MKNMRLLSIEKIARSKGIKDTWRFTKKELIKAIQKTEGFTDCFGSNPLRCGEMNCCWRSDCIK